MQDLQPPLGIRQLGLFAFTLQVSLELALRHKFGARPPPGGCGNKTHGAALRLNRPKT